MIKRSFLYIVCVLYFGIFSLERTYAAPSYYNDNRYERSSIYANVSTDESVKNIVQNATNRVNTQSSTKTIQDGKTKRVYNTIIVKTKKNKAEKIVNNDTTAITKIQPLQVKKVGDEKDPKEKTLMQKIQDYTNVFRQTTPDSFYFYGVIGYAMSMPRSIITTAIYENNELPDNQFNRIRVDGHNKGSGFGIIAGMKTYFNRNKIAIFFSPEVFYNRISVFTNSLNYNTLGSSWYTDTTPSEDNQAMERRVDVSVKVPASLKVQPKDMMGLSLRMGITIANFLSIFAKASLGGSYYQISQAVHPRGINWGVDNLTANNIATLTRNLSFSDGSFYNDIGDTSNKKKLTMLYGFGVGVELGFWNQHFIIRADYDHYFSSIRFKTENRYARIADTAAITDNITGTENNTSWKTRSSFGILRVTLGLAF